MKVWIVNPFDNLPLEGNRPQRYWLLAEAFAAAGDSVTLWTSDFSHSRKAKRVFVRELSADISLRLIETPQYNRNISLRRIYSHRVFAKHWLDRAMREDAPDLLIISMPPLALGVAAIEYCRKCNVRKPKFVVDIQDAWPETFERIVPRFMLAPLRRIAGKIYRSADVITAVAQRYIDLAQSYGARVPFHIARLAVRQTESVENAGLSTRLVYIGNMGASYDLRTVIEGVKRMKGVTLNLAGGGPHEPALRKLASGCDRIKFHGYLDEVLLHKLLMYCGVAVIPMFDSSCVGVPGKLADYVSAGLPVVNSLHGETERLLAEYGAGVMFEAGNVESFCAAVKAVQNQGRQKMQEGACRLAKEFDAELVYGEYVRFVSKPT